MTAKEQILKLWKDDPTLTRKAIANKVGCSIKHVYGVFWEADIKPHKKPTGIINGVTVTGRKAGRIAAMYNRNQHVRYSAIAAEVGCSYGYVIWILHRYGVYRNKRR